MGLGMNMLAAAGDPMSHVLDKDIIGPNGYIDPFGFSVLTINTLAMVVAFVILMLGVNAAASRIETGDESEGNERYVTKGRLAQVIEFLVMALRDNFVRPQLGAKADSYMPFLMTVFFFILINNLLGLVPLLDLQHLGALLVGWATGGPERAYEWSYFALVGGTATGRIAVTGALATIAFFFWNFEGIKENGIGGWAKHFTGGAPWYIWLIMIPVEIMGLFVKPAALAIRLFANMTAGHILLAVLIGFVPLTVLSSLALSPVGLIAFAGGVAIFFLEVFVAFLQAFIFFFLTTLFIAQMMHHEHHDEVHEGHATPFDAEHPTSEDPSLPVSAV